MDEKEWVGWQNAQEIAKKNPIMSLDQKSIIDAILDLHERMQELENWQDDTIVEIKRMRVYSESIDFRHGERLERLEKKGGR